MKLRAWLSFAACGAGLLLSGCGGGSAPRPVAPATSTLAGNWLIVGPMPTDEFELGAPAGFQLAMTFDVNGNNVVAGGFGSNSCGNVGGTFSFGSVVTGTIAADGSFSLQTQPNFPLSTMLMQGTVPKTNGAPWSGNYTVSLSSPFPTPPCQTSTTGTFTATSFPLVSGIYTGAASETTSVNGVLTTTTMALQFTLQQGGTEANPRGGTLTSNAVLTGSIKVQGSPCFSSGTMTGSPSSSVLGNEIHAAFTMDDGSTMEVLGWLTDVGESRIAASLLLVRGGQCGGNTVPVAYQLTELDRQS